jgi:glycosyltransferase involved in cell wall biosynthesis
MRHINIPDYIAKHNQSKDLLKTRVENIRSQINRLNSSAPDISIVIPAYNEAENILKTLSSLADSVTTKKVEIIVVNNNSQDETEELIRLTGATCILESKQGITHARNAGLAMAKGEYILNADADTIYPPEWIDNMVSPLYKPEVGMVYGNFAFIPTEGTPRPIFFVYEYMSDFSKWANKVFREEAVNIYGFNSAFRRKEGLQVDSFNHPAGTNEDGWLGVKLRNKFHKKFYYVGTSNATVWTTDRRIQIDGGLIKGTFKRFKRHLPV